MATNASFNKMEITSITESSSLWNENTILNDNGTIFSCKDGMTLDGQNVTLDGHDTGSLIVFPVSNSGWTLNLDEQKKKLMKLKLH